MLNEKLAEAMKQKKSRAHWKPNVFPNLSNLLRDLQRKNRLLG